MPINYCSINAYTINGRTCHNRFARPVQAAKSHVQQVRYPKWLDDHVEDDVDISNLESSNISITITLNGKEYSQTLENNFNDVIPMITIQKFDITIQQPIISINNFTVTFKKRNN